MSLRYDSVFDSWDWGGDLVNWGGVGVFLVVGSCALHFILYLYAYKRLMTILIYIDVRENLL